MKLRSFKLRLHERRARVVPAVDPEGCPFSGPGVDLMGSAADEAFRFAEPVLAALASIEPGVRVRSMSMDLEKMRLLATLHPAPGQADARPRVVRLDDGGALRMALREAGPLLDHLAQAAAEALRARRDG